eukprot:1450413-Prymnesium_polylepis.1
MGRGMPRGMGYSCEGARETAGKVARPACRGRRRHLSRHLPHWSAPRAMEHGLRQAMDCSRQDAQETPGKGAPPSHHLPQCCPALWPQADICSHRVCWAK